MSRCSDDLHLRAISGDVEARNEVVVANLPLADDYTRRNWRRLNLECWEVSAAAKYGLVLAASKYDPRRGTQFSTVAQYWMLKACLEAVCNAGSGSLIDGKARRAGRRPCGLMRSSAEGLEEHRVVAREDTLLSLVDDADELSWRLARLRDAVSGLPWAEREAFRLRHGLSGEPPMTCAQIADRVGGTGRAALGRAERAMEKVKRILGRGVA